MINYAILIICNLIVRHDYFLWWNILMRDLKVMGSVDNTYADVVCLSVEVDAGRVGTNAISINTRPGEFPSCYCEISVDQDWLAIMDRGTNATIHQTKIRFAACRGIFANPSFTIKDFNVSNCGAYGIKGRSIKLSKDYRCGTYDIKDRSGWNIVGDNTGCSAWPIAAFLAQWLSEIFRET